ncbi:MAG TPA: metal ABC transporter ATP-binding protein [Rectinemataceae bacterium]|nr:metal ABC transporter ATP-binding protein [Rectinemataceae bacterium]
MRLSRRVAAVTPFAAEPARLDVEGVAVGYEGRTVFEGLTFRLEHGTRAAIVGPNGAGKSTLFKALVGLLPLRAGRVLIHGLPLGSHLDCVAYIPQRENVDWNFPVTVRDVVTMGRYGHLHWLQRPSRRDRAIIDESLDRMGITELASRSINELSGGQQQRVFLARALAQEPHIFLMDEPFNGVDRVTQDATLELLDHLREKDVTVLISTHDLNLAATRFDSVLLINHGLVAYGPPDEVLSEANLARAFGSSLLVKAGATLLVDECCPEGHHGCDDCDGYDGHVHEEPSAQASPDLGTSRRDLGASETLR